MEKLEILLLYRLEFRNTEFPFGEDFRAVKLSIQEAMAFSGSNVKTFDDLLTRYGANNKLKVGEYYNGYLAIYFWYGRAEVVKMRGHIQRVDPKTPIGGPDYVYRNAVRKGLVWECILSLEGGKTAQGPCKDVWTFRDCAFANSILRGKKRGQKGYENLDSEVIDKSLKEKLVEALQKEEKSVELTDEENMVLKHYLGEERYKRFFVKVE